VQDLADDDERVAESGRAPDGSVRPSVLVELERAECIALLGEHRVGRIAVVDRDEMPFVVPVNYVLSSETVLFRTHPGTKLDALRRRPVAFQVDAIDEVRRTGWSVLIQGVAHDASPDDHVVAHPEPWTEAGPYWIQIVPRSISGRRFRIDEDLS
jgi:nitroimidazol reductase NimA-like FMN-containing flavoprotein (pyridoxamine 5'-phosphate oxidase superfamily)